MALLETCKSTLLSQSEFYHGFRGNRVKLNDRNDRTSFQFFCQTNDFDLCFTGQSHFVSQNLDFHFLCLSNPFLFGGRICAAFVFLEYRA